MKTMDAMNEITISPKKYRKEGKQTKDTGNDEN